MQARVRLTGWARLALAPVLLLAVLWTVDVEAVLRQLAGARPHWLLAGLASAIASNLVSAWRWCSLVRWLGHAVRQAWAQTIYFQSMAVGALLPGAVVGGDVFRALALRRSGQGALEAGLAVLLDRLSGLWMLWVLAVSAAAWGGAEALPALGVVLAPGALLVLAGALVLMPALALLGLRRATRADASAALWRQRVHRLAQRGNGGREYGRQLLASLAVQLLSVGALACAGRAMGLELPFWCYAVAAAPTFLMAALPVSFGGWGTREAAAALSLGLFGVAAPVAVAASLLYGLMGVAQALFGALLLARPVPFAGST
ncbi:lysylphosphatidylglycerol synthase transmembrane domain-containing protein [Pseudorhodoferax sp. Leaf267]|uniref:lysylphosphatidylglycerol synthase transmembrane domain-containing protein n=1 Tax=Pseudorhodoferax sp. Leaf267 TaxID=1736316 RepID=UPI0006F5876B|nr:lysylphosphatidylglycerol synthase transmembrane domain-containing protein [Pseudorhodoferax sp. Leaf267]KQP22994.1 hypothetical protein ASF43_03655 [Pseudorhodoferax sp. Leaf267]